MTGHLEITVCCDYAVPGGEGFCGLFRGLLGLVEANLMDCRVDNQDRMFETQSIFKILFI